ncbi:MAG: hsdR1 [Bacteroidetes bacterium]|nr:hsdR1 [Bacteroidota bacterium]MBP1616572.1 hsdR1 [Bacteroidota bacterium]
MRTESSFIFLNISYPELFAFGQLAERLVSIDPSSSLAKSRLCAEKITKLIIEFERLDFIEDTQFDKIDKLYTNGYLPVLIKDIFHIIRKSGNKAAHSGIGDSDEALLVLSKLFDLTKWFYQTYENVDLGNIKYTLPTKVSNTQEVKKLTDQLESLQTQLHNYEDKIKELNSTKASKSRRKRSENLAKKIEFDEKETRLLLIDPKLRNAGWECDTDRLNYKKCKTLPQKGRNIAIAEWRCGDLWADYALFVGTTLYGVIEAKRFSGSISTNLHQSKIYSQNCDNNYDISLLGEWERHKIPFLFSTNGREYLEQIKTESGIWFADARYPRKMPIPLRDWYSPNGLVELYKRDIDQINTHLKSSEIDYLQDKSGLSLYDFQVSAIKAIENKIISDTIQRRALLVMATGTGKTRTAIGLSYRLIKSNRFRRILFLTDRRILAKQAADDFKDKKIENLNTFAEIYQISDLKDLLPDSETRIHFTTVQGMVKRLFHSDIKDDVNPHPLSVDAYDCIIVDEAHRGYNLDKELDEDDLYFRDQEDYVSQYKKVIEYFDAYIIGLTATPALHTTQIFGTPVFTYSYREAVIDGYLVDHEPPYSIKTELSENGMVWEKGERPKAYNPENNNIEELSELEDELHIEIEQFNKQVITESFNRTVIKELVNHLDPDGDEKTLIFAARDSHADMIVNLLFEEFAAIGIDVHQDAIKKITGKSTYDPGTLTLHFKNERFPNIVVTVDLLTTGVDVPAITNLVFMRRVRSRILFEQMMGRATRKSDAFKKDYFRIFDAVRVYEALEHFTQMQTVSNPAFTFEELIDEFGSITNDERKVRQIEQIVTKLQRAKEGYYRRPFRSICKTIGRKVASRAY